jgi:polysaccharide biosynthesis/export protein
MGRTLTFLVLVFVACLAAPKLITVAAQEQQSNPQSGATTAKPGAAGGVWSPALTGVRRPLYRLRTSDQVEIDFTFSPEFNQTVTVQPDGYIPLRGTKRLFVEGSSVPELEEAIRVAYAGILHDPEVTVVLKDFDRPYFIAAGEVGHPGKYELRADTTVAEAVAIAGGFTPRAKHSQVVLFRRVTEDVVESHLLNVKALLNSRNLGEDAHLMPGDFLFVPQNLISKIRQFLPASNLSLYASSAQF